MANDRDEAALRNYLECLRRAIEMSRQSVRNAATEDFATDRIVDRVIRALEEVWADQPTSGASMP